MHGANIFTGHDLAELLDGTATFDAVAFARRPTPEPKTVESLLAAGKHVLVIDHPGWQSDEMESLLRTAERAGVQLAVLNSNRYQPSRKLVKQQIADHLGPVGLLRSYRWEPNAADILSPVAGLPAGLIDDLDLALCLCGQPVERVYAVEHAIRDAEEPTGRYLQVHLGFTSGMALIDYTNRLPPGDSYQSLSVIGFSGAAYAEDDQNMQLAFRGGEAKALPTTRHPILAWTAVVQEFVDALAGGHDLAHSITDWRQVFALADAVNRSLASRQSIVWEGH
jgi:predicted dehydrogenase